ncbi:MAG: OPT/YSL family transporter [Myxococcales bacterium]|nr:OPT/YSL family transporter [Myxococcales bacterium]
MSSLGDSSTPEQPAPQPPSGDTIALEMEWVEKVYQGDHVKQATARAILMGALLGGALSLQNLYVGLKTGWGLGVAITACVLSFTIYNTLVRLAPKVFGPPMSVLENNCMQSTASSAGYSTGGVMTSAIAAYLILNGKHIGWVTLALWTFFLAVLGTVMAIPMKRQMVNIEKLPFPSGIAAAETLKSLHAESDAGQRQARALGRAAMVGAVISWFRDAHPGAKAGAILKNLTRFNKFPEMIAFPGATGAKLAALGVHLEGSLIFIAAGALMGLRTTISMLVAGLLNFVYVGPKVYALGGISALTGSAIRKWSLWPGASIMVASGLLTFALQWRTILRAFSGLGGRKKLAADDPNAAAEARIAAIEVPSSWFVGGMAFASVGLVAVGKVSFGISWWMSILAILLTFFLSLVACRATGETDTTPIGAMGKITQLTYGVVAPGNVTTNLMTASITAGAAGSSADLLTDLKSGYLLGANPRKQFLAQLVGTVVGTAVTVPMFYILVPTKDVLLKKFAAPSAKVWAGVAELLSKGLSSLHPTAVLGIKVGVAIGVILPLLELRFPKYKKYIPSATGVGLALVIDAHNSMMMFFGAVLAWLWTKQNKAKAEEYTVALSSGIIAGESLMAVFVLLLGALEYLAQ